MKKFLALSAALAALLVSSTVFAQPQRRMTPNDTLKSVRVLADGTTIFSIYAPKARTVSLAGDAVPWGQPLVPVEKDGVWSFRVPNVKPGVYRYHFVVDGVQVYDPKSPTTTQNTALAVVEPNGKEFFSYNPDIPHGAMAVRSYWSKTVGQDETSGTLPDPRRRRHGRVLADGRMRGRHSRQHACGRQDGPDDRGHAQRRH